MEINIGDKFWSFSANRRFYAGRGSSARVIYRKHFFPVEIIGDTSRSWSIGMEGSTHEIFKVPKADPFREKYGEFGERPMIFTDQMIEDECWRNENRTKIIRAIERVDTLTLRRIAEMINYSPPQPPACNPDG